MDATDRLPANDLPGLTTSARIDAQDESYILPIREYLETHGVEAVVNGPQGADFLYHIVAGDATYVKQIFSREHRAGVKRLGIVLAGGKVAVEFSGKTKIVIAHPTPMTVSEVMEVFEFFFTEGKNHLDLRGHQETRTVHEPLQSDDDRVSSIIADVFKEEATPVGRALKEKKHRRRRRMHLWVLGMLITIGILVVPAVWYGMSMVFGGAAVVSAARAFRQGDFGAVNRSTRFARYWTSQGALILNTAAVPFSWSGGEDILRGQERLVSFMTDTVTAEEQAQALTTVATRVASGLVNQVDSASTGTTAASDISELRVSLYTLGNTLGLAQAELTMLLADRTFPFSIGPLFTRGSQAVGDLADIRESAGDVDKLLSLFLSIAGFKEPRTYIVLLQNSMELRPTGGFIGSVAVASFADGRLTNLDIQDVYTFDGQLKGHVDPPTPIRELLGQEHWYLRDSNWDPDFKEAGARAAWFYEKETGTTVDGVIGISTPFITDLLGATGPVELPDYHDRITAENFYGKSIYYTQNDFFPGSTQKKDFLGSLSHAILTAITGSRGAISAKLFGAITAALGSHDLTMMFIDPRLQSLAEHYGWAGRVPAAGGCTGTSVSACEPDPFVAVEANLGVNKVNYFVTRALEREIAVQTDGTRTETATITIHNGSGSQDKNLPYRAYVRFILPPGASAGNVTLDGKVVPVRSTAKTAAQVPYTETSTVASGMRAIGVALDVQAASEKKLSISYVFDRPFSFGTGGTVLDVFTQKQPGISGEAVRTVITYPGGWTAGIEDRGAGSAPRDFIAKPGRLEYNTNLTRDDLTRVRFTKP